MDDLETRQQELLRQKMVADAILAERTAAMFRRRYPAGRPESLDFVIAELSSFAASMRRKAQPDPAPGAGMNCEFYPLCRCREVCGRG